MSQPVVYVHGLWMPGEESLILRRRLANGFDLALQAFRYSAASSSMGEITGHLDSFVRELKAPAVHFLGHVSPIQGAIEGSAVIVVPSMGEGFGMVALEAMERSRPVIAAAIGGLGELVRHGETGLLVAPGEAEPLRAAIVELAGDLERAARMGEAGRRRALADFL